MTSHGTFSWAWGRLEKLTLFLFLSHRWSFTSCTQYMRDGKGAFWVVLVIEILNLNYFIRERKRENWSSSIKRVKNKSITNLIEFGKFCFIRIKNSQFISSRWKKHMVNVSLLLYWNYKQGIICVILFIINNKFWNVILGVNERISKIGRHEWKVV